MTTAVSNVSTDTVQTAIPQIGSSAYFGQVMFGLAIVLVSIFAIAWVVRRFSQGNFLANGNMKVVGSLALGTRERAVLVKVNGQQMLLGVTQGSVSSLHVFAPENSSQLSEPRIDSVDDKSGVLPSELIHSEFGKKVREFVNKGSMK